MFIKIRRRSTEVSPKDDNLKEILAFDQKLRKDGVGKDKLSEAVSEKFKNSYVVVGDWDEVLIQCDKIRLTNLLSGEANGIDNLYLTTYRDGKEEHYLIEKLDSEVYFMNDNGKTIDRLVW